MDGNIGCHLTDVLIHLGRLEQIRGQDDDRLLQFFEQDIRQQIAARSGKPCYQLRQF